MLAAAGGATKTSLNSNRRFKYEEKEGRHKLERKKEHVLISNIKEKTN